MKLFGRSDESLKGDEAGFIHEYIACRINAIIEVLNLPVKQLSDASPDSIMNKLNELSDERKYWHTPEDQIYWLDRVIEQICESDEMIERVNRLTRINFEAFTGVHHTV